VDGTERNAGEVCLFLLCLARAHLFVSSIATRRVLLIVGTCSDSYLLSHLPSLSYATNLNEVAFVLDFSSTTKPRFVSWMPVSSKRVSYSVDAIHRIATQRCSFESCATDFNWL
jgi:hypothetical protein